jgi:2-amino-4-hydroxy-6-hydroxymethyldihydropteridine diphosphokinase
MSNVYLLIGGNQGDRLYYLKEAVNQIRKNIGNIIQSSSVYETEPYGFRDECLFLNQCLLVETNYLPRNVLKIAGNIETSLGRIRRSGVYDSRTIDIDILFYDDLILNDFGLIIPHPEFHKRNFALIPMSEIDPGFIHPVIGKNISDLLKESPDQHKVAMFSDPRSCL